MSATAKQKSLVPELRFSGFDGEWAQYSLSELVNNVGGTALESHTDKQGTHKFISIGNYSTTGIYIDNGQRVVLNDKTKTKLLDKNNLAMVLNDKTASGDIIGSTILIDEDDSYIYNQRTERLVCKENFLPKYAWLYLNSPRFRKRIVKISQGGTQIYVNFPSVKRELVLIPKSNEQQKIADFLGSVDAWLDNLRAQKTALQSYKQGMMQKLFSGQVRFKDEAGKSFPDWITSNLDSLGEVKTSSVDKLSSTDERPVKLLNYMDVYRRDHVYNADIFQDVTANDREISTFNLRQGDILFTPSSETPIDIGHSAVVMEDLDEVLYSYHLVRFRPKENVFIGRFAGYAFKSYLFYKEFWRRAQGATRYTLSLESIKDASVTYPPSLAEQQKIADFLTALDQTITAKADEITKVEEWKKGLMQKMFV